MDISFGAYSTNNVYVNVAFSIALCVISGNAILVEPLFIFLVTSLDNLYQNYDSSYVQSTHKHNLVVYKHGQLFCAGCCEKGIHH